MTDWSDVRRDEPGDWETATGLVPQPVLSINRSRSVDQWRQAAEFCAAVAGTMQAEAEEKERSRESEIEERIRSIAMFGRSPIGERVQEIIAAVREHDA